MMNTHRDMQFELKCAAAQIRASKQNTMRAQTLDDAAVRLGELDEKIGDMTVLLRECRLQLRQMLERPQENYRAEVEQLVRKINLQFGRNKV